MFEQLEHVVVGDHRAPPFRASGVEVCRDSSRRYSREVLFGAMQSLLRGVGSDLEHGGYVGDRELLPCCEPEHFRVGSAEAGRGIERKPVFGAVDHGLVRRNRVVMNDETQPGLERSTPRSTRHW